MKNKWRRNLPSSVAARLEREKAAKERTPEEQIANLDALFGPGQGAKKERAKLAARIAAAAPEKKVRKRNSSKKR